jgi:hypothetical protein
MKLNDGSLVDSSSIKAKQVAVEFAKVSLDPPTVVKETIQEDADKEYGSDVGELGSQMEEFSLPPEFFGPSLADVSVRKGIEKKLLHSPHSELNKAFLCVNESAENDLKKMLEDDNDDMYVFARTGKRAPRQEDKLVDCPCGEQV